MMRRLVSDYFRPRAAVLLAAAMALGTSAQAQLARPRVTPPDAPKLLILPFNRDNVDSALSLVVADGVRERIRTAHIDKFNSITRENLCRNLTESGFQCDVPLDGQTIRNLLRFLNVRLAIEGSMIRRRGDSMIVVARLYEATGTPPTTVTVSVSNSMARIGASTGGEIANRLVDGFRSFDEVAECRRRLDLRNYVGAMQQAQSAIRQFPGNAGAYVCIARILEAQNASADSVLGAFRAAYDRDTLNPAVMRLLASRYQTKGDTANLLDMLKRILTIDFRDNDLRINTIKLMVQMGQIDSAIALANKGLVDNPASAELLGAKAIAMAAAGHWDSAAVAMVAVSEIDSSKVDSLFIYRLTNYFRQIPDSAGYLTWVRNATVKFPTQAPYWYTLAEMIYSRGDTTGAVTAGQHYVALRPDDSRGHLALARYHVGAKQLDSALAHAQLVTDSTLRPFTARVFLSAGMRSYQDSAYTAAIERLTSARERTTDRAVITPAAFFTGISQFRIAQHSDSLAEQGRACDPAREAQRLWDQVEQNMIVGAAQNRELANQFLSQYIPAYRQRAETFIRQFCR